MTEEQFNNLKKGDRIELLDLNFQRTGEIYPIFHVARSKDYCQRISIVILMSSRKKPKRISNHKRVEFPHE